MRNSQVAERILGVKAECFGELSEHEPDKMHDILEAAVGKRFFFKFRGKRRVFQVIFPIDDDTRDLARIALV